MKQTLTAKQLAATGILAKMMAPTITAADIKEAEEATTEYQAASAAKNKAEKRRDKALSLIFEKAIGVNSLDEVKRMPLPQIKKAFAERLTIGLVKVEKSFDILQTHQTTTIPYKDELINAKGQAYVMGLTGTMSFTYQVIQNS